MADLNQSENKSTYELKRTHRIGDKEYPLTPGIGEDPNWILLTAAASIMREKLSKVRKISAEQAWEKKYDMDPKSNGRNMFTYVKKSNAIDYANSKLILRPTDAQLKESPKEGEGYLGSDPGQGSGKELEQSKNVQVGALLKTLEDIPSLKNNIKILGEGLGELQGDNREIHRTMQTSITRAIEQGIDLKERYLEDRIKRTEIERIQAESLAKQTEILVSLEKIQMENSSKQKDALSNLEKNIALKQEEQIKKLLEDKNNKPSNKAIVWIISILAVLAIGGGIGYWQYHQLDTANDRVLAENDNIQKENTVLKTTVKNLQDEYQSVMQKLTPPVQNEEINAVKKD